MSMSRIHRLAGTVAVILLAGCASGGMAPVVDRSDDAAAPRAADVRVRSVGADSGDAAVEHRVVRGDTLYGIAFRHGLDFRALAARNGIAEPYTIYPGQVLRLRDAPPPMARESRPARPAENAASASARPATAAAAPAAAALPRPALVAREGDTEVYAVGDGSPATRDGQLALEPLEPLAPPSVAPSPAAGARPATAAAEPPAAPPPVTTAAAPGALAAAVAADPGRRPGPAATTAAVPAPSAPPAVATRSEPAASAPTTPQPATRAEAAAAAPVTTVASPSAALPPTIVPGPSRTVAGIAWRWPTAGNLIGRYTAGDPARQGIDIAGNEGQAVLAAAAGEVVYSGNGLIGYGELIIIKHSNELLSAYGHNRRRLVAEGQRVVAGQAIAEMGRSGGQLSQLHFEIRRAGRPVDPLDYLPPR
jgi:lipoprotein NlpD